MPRMVSWFIVLGIAIGTAIACDNPTSPDSQPGGVPGGATVGSLGQTRVPVCHSRGKTGEFSLASLPLPAVQAHLAHGDCLIGEMVPGMPFKVFGSACEPIDYTGPIVYTYQGNPFNLFKGTFGCPPECALSGWFSLSDTLTPSALVKVDRPILDDFAFSDANYTLTPVNDLQAQFTLMVRTDASGRLDFSQGWCLSLQGDYRADRPGGANYYHRFLSTSNQLRSSEFGCGGELGSANDGSAYVASVVGSAEVFSSPGDWSTSIP